MFCREGGGRRAEFTKLSLEEAASLKPGKAVQARHGLRSHGAGQTFLISVTI